MTNPTPLLDFLSSRRSVKAQMLTEPAPDDATLAALLQTGMSAPDHGAIRPWRFKVIRGDDRTKLSDLFETALRKRDPAVDDEMIATIRSKPLRSPLIIAIGVNVVEGHPKVPVIEQVVATACATEHFLLAAHAAGYGAVLLTGWPAFDETVRLGLGFEKKDKMVGFVYLGTPVEEPRSIARPDVRQYMENWNGPA